MKATLWLAAVVVVFGACGSARAQSARPPLTDEELRRVRDRALDRARDIVAEALAEMLRSGEPALSPGEQRWAAHQVEVQGMPALGDARALRFTFDPVARPTSLLPALEGAGGSLPAAGSRRAAVRGARVVLAGLTLEYLRFASHDDAAAFAAHHVSPDGVALELRGAALMLVRGSAVSLRTPGDARRLERVQRLAWEGTREQPGRPLVTLRGIFPSGDAGVCCATPAEPAVFETIQRALESMRRMSAHDPARFHWQGDGHVRFEGPNGFATELEVNARYAQAWFARSAESRVEVAQALAGDEGVAVERARGAADALGALGE